MSCGNCSKDITGVFRRKRKCLNCQKKFCGACFMASLDSGISIKGHCNNCYIQLNPETINYPKYFGMNIPTLKQHQDFLNTSIEPIKSNPLSVFTKLKKLGEGSTSNVFQVENEEKKIFALKEIKVKLNKTVVYEEFSKSVINQNPNIVSCYALYFFNNMHSLLQEYMDMTLLQFLQNWQRDNETIMAYIILQIVKGIQFIHSLFVIHRDLKAENIYVNFQGDVKIGDFGLSAQLCREKDERETVAGSPLWNSPEIINGRKYKCSCDIWSLGIICFEVISAVTPYSNCKNFVELAAKINKGPEPRIPENFSQDFQEFVRLCLQNDPGRRASAGDLLSTNFLRRVDEVSVKEEFAELVKAQIQLTSRDVVIDNNG